MKLDIRKSIVGVIIALSCFLLFTFKVPSPEKIMAMGPSYKHNAREVFHDVLSIKAQKGKIMTKNSTLDFHKKTEIKDRLIHLKENCDKMKDNQYSLDSLPKYILRRLLVSEKHKFVFCLIPKVSATSWRRMFLRLSGDHSEEKVNNLTNFEIFNTMYKQYDLLVKHSKEDISRILQNYTKAMFVRNPFDRILSAYRSKFVTSNQFHRKYGATIVKKFRPNGTKRAKQKGDDVTFFEFLQFITSSKSWSQNYHWAPYWNLCLPCLINYDYIGIFENLENESNSLLKYIKAESLEFPKRNKHYSTDKTDAVRKLYYSGIPQRYQSVIKEKYKNDFKLFSFLNWSEPMFGTLK